VIFGSHSFVIKSVIVKNVNVLNNIQVLAGINTQVLVMSDCISNNI